MEVGTIIDELIRVGHQEGDMFHKLHLVTVDIKIIQITQFRIVVMEVMEVIVVQCVKIFTKYINSEKRKKREISTNYPSIIK